MLSPLFLQVVADTDLQVLLDNLDRTILQSRVKSQPLSLTQMEELQAISNEIDRRIFGEAN